MATKVNVVVVDDLDGSQPAQTVHFALDGKDYEIDLSEANAAALREAVEPYVRAARAVTDPSAREQGRRSSRRRTASASGGPSETTLARQWAVDNGIKVNSRGRLPTEILEMYRASLSD